MKFALRWLAVCTTALSACSSNERSSEASQEPAAGSELAARVSVARSTGVLTSLDDSLHRQGTVLSGGVAIHYLDWGGAGEPIVLIPGLGSSAHTFDEFAPLLATQYRVVGITRRGYGQSGQPTSGYETRSLSEDVLAVLNQLGLRRVTLVGHSLGGAEAVWLAVHHPSRVSRVILLESYCYGCPQTPPPLAEKPPGRPPARPSPTSADRQSFGALREFNARLTGATAPEAEIAATHHVEPDGTVGGRNEAGVAAVSIRAGLARSEIERIRQPTLLVLAVERGPEDAVRWIRPLVGPDSAWAHWSADVHQRSQRAWATLFNHLQPRGEIKWVPGGSHHVYQSNASDVAAIIQAFIG